MNYILFIRFVFTKVRPGYCETVDNSRHTNFDKWFILFDTNCFVVEENQLNLSAIYNFKINNVACHDSKVYKTHISDLSLSSVLNVKFVVWSLKCCNNDELFISHVSYSNIRLVIFTLKTVFTILKSWNVYTKIIIHIQALKCKTFLKR